MLQRVPTADCRLTCGNVTGEPLDTGRSPPESTQLRSVYIAPSYTCHRNAAMRPVIDLHALEELSLLRLEVVMCDVTLIPQLG